jgi:hypothetical protein
MVHYFNVTYLEGRWKIVDQGQSNQEIRMIISKNKLDVVIRACSPSYMGGRGRKIII